ncbi:competence protein ComK [Aciduricibacillus chroicocephali]|uniref:Competence protein ComK n=1 Tax=Aciduricibacillus chroicocephali TaxID=3054939 RepID=A0ABY9KXY9_9BACI|nr:competence protein ComK [Bacillaceae bacterium 44XB]
MTNHLYATSYEVNPLTLAILSRKDEKGRTTAYVLEQDAEYVVSRTPTNIIDQSCSYFGASLKGRQEGTRSICGITHKAPISIDPASGMYFFPTASPSNALCSWIAHSHIETLHSLPNQNTEITFKNGTSIVVEASQGSIMNQVQRTAHFRYLLDKRLQGLPRSFGTSERLPVI